MVFLWLHLHQNMCRIETNIKEYKSGKNNPDINTNQNNIINQDVKIDLEIFEGLGLDKDNSIFSNINLCQTNLGGFLLKNILGNPTKDLDTLLARQNIIKKIVNDEKYYQDITTSLNAIKENETNIL